jgi:hypothetical protein
MRKVIVGAAVAAIALLGSAGAGVAGEVTGQGRGTPILAEDGPSDRVGHFAVAPSACAFSGLEDTAGPGVTQTPAGSRGAPGFACRGSGGGAIKP